MRNTLRLSFVLLVLLALSLLSACDEPGRTPRIRLATTTSTEDSGLLEYLLPPFEEREGVKVDTVAAGTGRALALGKRGDADIVLVHARAKEDEFVAEGHGIDRRDIMWNDFVIAGPAGDPAGAGKAATAAEALKRIAAANAKFISRGDDSGTHTREKELWQAAGMAPDWPGYEEAGQGMGACLNMASQKGAYVLSDRGTFLSFGRELDLAVLVEGDPALRNPYGAILVNPAEHSHVNADGARKLLDYLTSREGQERIASFRKNGKVLFHPHSES